MDFFLRPRFQKDSRVHGLKNSLRLNPSRGHLKTGDTAPSRAWIVCLLPCCLVLTCLSLVPGPYANAAAYFDLAVQMLSAPSALHQSKSELTILYKIFFSWLTPHQKIFT